MDWLGALIGGGAQLLGGLFGQQNQEQINQQNIAAQQSINQQNLQQQLNFAQHGVQWRADDARAAGINPLAALGASTNSFSNLVAPQSQASGSMAQGVAGMGQDLARAIQATRSPEEQAIAMEKTRQDLEAGQLDNELKKAQLASSIANVKQPGTGPGLRTGGVPGLPSGVVAGPDASTVYVRTPDGGFQPNMSKFFQDTNYNFPAEMGWMYKNQMAPFFGATSRAPDQKHNWSYEDRGHGGAWYRTGVHPRSIWDSLDAFLAN